MLNLHPESNRFTEYQGNFPLNSMSKNKIRIKIRIMCYKFLVIDYLSLVSPRSTHTSSFTRAICMYDEVNINLTQFMSIMIKSPCQNLDTMFNKECITLEYQHNYDLNKGSLRT